MRPSIPAPPRCPLAAVVRTAANQNHNMFAILAEVDPIAGAEVDLVLKHAGTNALDLREIPLRHTCKRNRYLGCRRGAQSFEPMGETFVSVFINVAAKLDHSNLW